MEGCGTWVVCGFTGHRLVWVHGVVKATSWIEWGAYFRSLKLHAASTLPSSAQGASSGLSKSHQSPTIRPAVELKDLSGRVWQAVVQEADEFCGPVAGIEAAQQVVREDLRLAAR